MLDICSQKLGCKSLDDVLDILSDVVGILLRMRTILMCSFVGSMRFPQALREVCHIASSEARYLRWIAPQNVEHGVVRNYVHSSFFFFYPHVVSGTALSSNGLHYFALDPTATWLGYPHEVLPNAYHECRPILPGHAPVVYNLEYCLLHRSLLYARTFNLNALEGYLCSVTAFSSNKDIRHSEKSTICRHARSPPSVKTSLQRRMSRSCYQ
jgi:hypothetical protein